MFADLANNRLLSYIITMRPSYVPGRHHKIIADALEEVTAGRLKRLMIFMPPRHGKSMETSQYFPPWYLGKRPSDQFIFATYAQEFADDWGRLVRDQLLDPRHNRIFPSCLLRSDTQSVQRLATTAGGVYYAAGVGGPITGRGADILLIDDPIKGREDADSDVMRKKLKNWYTAVAYTRLQGNASIVLIQTRWHEDDLAGWLLKEHKHENWHVIEMPAIDEAGDALWPEMFPIERLLQIRKTLSVRDWSALYMQSPAPDEGAMFKSAWFKDYDVVPPGSNYYGASDYAATPDDNDYTEHGVFAVDKDRNIYFVDWWTGQQATDVWIDAQVDLIQLHAPLAWVGEAGPIRRAIEPFLEARMIERVAWTTLHWLPSIMAKEVRVRGFQALASLGKVYFPRTAWAGDVKRQLLQFPTGKYDDKVDVCSLIGRALESIVFAGVEPPKPRDRYAIKRQNVTTFMSR